MKKLALLASGAILAGLLTVMAWADSGTPQKSNGQALQSAAGQTAVSQTQIDTVKKREEARKRRDRKLKVRAKNLQKSPMPNDKLLKPAQ